MPKPLPRQGLFLRKANVQIATVDSQVLVTDFPVPSRKKETGDSLWSHCNEHVGSMHVNVQTLTVQVADLATINLKVCQLLFCSSVLAVAITLAS